MSDNVSNKKFRILKEHPFPIQIEGLPYIGAGLLLFACSAAVWADWFTHETISQVPREVFVFLMVLSGVFSLFSIWFYRNPNRKTPNDPSAVFSPADGTVLKVQEIPGDRIGQARAKKVSIFMSPLNVHVNRFPLDGKIEKISYNRGKFFKADLDKASEENEHNWLVVQSLRGAKVAFVQIAGFVARRIMCYVEEGEQLSAGERYGMIRFGSRMEIVVPYDSQVLVKKGDKTLAGVTVIARLV